MSFGLEEALAITLRAIKPLPVEDVDLVASVGRVAATSIRALVNSPSIDASLKDGYAVRCREIVEATAEKPIRLRLLGSLAAGGEEDIRIKAGTAVRVLTGARIPTGADAVLAGEMVKREGDRILIETPVEVGKNILRRGTDVALRRRIIQKGQQKSPGLAGLLAAAGHSRVPVFRNPVVGIIGTGDEIVAPGKPLGKGMLYASNIMTLAGWCDKYKMKTLMTVVKDDYDVIYHTIERLSDETDVIITSGGAWTGDHDIVAHVLGELGWKQAFHHIRIGPGKAVGFGMLNGKPVFILPGGPPSNLMGFLQIALPGLLALSGHTEPGLPRIKARLASEMRGRENDWTDFFFGNLDSDGPLPVFYPLKYRSRLSSIADAPAVASVPEGHDCVPEGSVISVQLLI
jgi:molybdopterin molybdotransferase